MNRILLSVLFMSMIPNIGNSQCGITGIQSQMLQNSSVPISNNSTSGALVSVINGNYPTTIGIELQGDTSNSKFINNGENGSVVADALTALGNYQVRIENFAAGCDNTVTVSVVSILPVEWLRPLYAISNNNNIEVEFATAQQINNSHFEIERSRDGVNFSQIGRLEGEGTTSTENHYKFIDNNPMTGNNYYRIKQVDFDGQYDYSNVASVLVEINESKVFPNPSNGVFSVTSNRHQKIRILNQLGEIVKEALMEEGENVINISTFSNGVYYLQIGDKTETIIKE